MSTGHDRGAAIVGSLALFILAGGAAAFHWDLVLRDPELAPAIPLTEGMQRTLAGVLSTPVLFACTVGVLLLLWLMATAVVLFRGADTGQLFRRSVELFALVLPWSAFDVGWLILRPSGATAGLKVLIFALPLLNQLVPAALLARGLSLVVAPGSERRLTHKAARWWLGGMIGTYFCVFATLSVLQYVALMVPHGDTAMYEEHLWNLLHGKGFRSQLDGGRLFLGEHIEFIHIFLIPIYVLYPCLPTLNVVYTAALAVGAVPVYGLARVAGASRGTALLLAGAYLLYPPLEYLNLEASLKTFRPENLAVPLILAAFWAMEKGAWKWAVVAWLFALTAKEDYAILLASLGLYLALRSRATRRSRCGGVMVALAGAAYLWFAVAVAIPYFRGGPPHYMAYYPSLGRTPSEVLQTATRKPDRLVALLFREENANLLALLLLPLAGLPLLAPSRAAVALPSALPLLLGELPGLKQPLFHFHAPLVPVFFWALTGALRRPAVLNRQRGASLFVFLLCLMANFWWGKSPLSVSFWDPHSGLQGYYRDLYVPGERVERFWQAYPLVPQTASVAATDYVRPRFTHHRECHEIGAGGLKPHVRPEQVDYLVIDLRGPYSDPEAGLRVPLSIPHPSGWETVYRDEYFLVTRAAGR